MYDVSVDYIAEMQNAMVRNPSYIKVHLGLLTDVRAQDPVSVTSDGEMYYSEVADVAKIKPVQKRYYTFEHNQMVLDGLNILAPETTDPIDYYQGYVGSTISDTDGIFADPPYITIEFANNHQFNGLTFKFDSALNSFSDSILVVGYFGASEIFSKTYSPNAIEYVVEETLPATGTINKLLILFNATTPPYRRPILESILFGISKVYDDTVITDSTWTRELDLVTSKLPTNTFEFDMLDLNKDYDPDASGALLSYVEKNQPMYFEYGYELDSGVIEWVYGNTMRTTGKVTSSSNGSISQVKFNATSRLAQLTDIYYKGTFTPVNYSLEYLAQQIFAFAGITEYYIDPLLASITTTIAMPEVPVNQALQIVANCAKCLFYVDRNGIFNIRKMYDVCNYSLEAGTLTITYTDPPFVKGDIVGIECIPTSGTGNLSGIFEVDTVTAFNFTVLTTWYTDDAGVLNLRSASDFTFDFDKLKSIPRVSKQPMLRTVETKYHTVKFASSSSELCTVDFDTTDGLIVIISHEPAKDVLVTISAGFSVISSESYARTTIVSIGGSGTGTITVSGKKATITDVQYTYTPDSTVNGISCPVDNPLNNTKNKADLYSQWIAYYLLKRNLYDVEERGYPELDMNDMIYIDTLYSTSSIPAIITYNKLNYNGALSAQTKFMTIS